MIINFGGYNHWLAKWLGLWAGPNPWIGPGHGVTWPCRSDRLVEWGWSKGEPTRGGLTYELSHFTCEPMRWTLTSTIWRDHGSAGWSVTKSRRWLWVIAWSCNDRGVDRRTMGRVVEPMTVGHRLWVVWGRVATLNPRG